MESKLILAVILAFLTGSLGMLGLILFNQGQTMIGIVLIAVAIVCFIVYIQTKYKLITGK